MRKRLPRHIVEQLPTVLLGALRDPFARRRSSGAQEGGRRRRSNIPGDDRGLTPPITISRVRRLLLLAGALVALVGLSAASCGNDGKDISIAEVGRADVVEVVDAPASIIARAAATL